MRLVVLVLNSMRVSIWCLGRSVETQDRRWMMVFEAIRVGIRPVSGHLDLLVLRDNIDAFSLICGYDISCLVSLRQVSNYHTVSQSSESRRDDSIRDTSKTTGGRSTNLLASLPPHGDLHCDICVLNQILRLPASWL